jgi:hypothetical protein
MIKEKWLMAMSIVMCLFGALHAQKSPCKIKPKFELSSKKAYQEDYNLRLLDIIEEDKDYAGKSEYSRVLIFHYYFDETNKFHKTAEDYLDLLKDSLKSLTTDIEVVFKVQKIRGSIFVNDGNEHISSFHLNALVYSNDLNLLNEIFGAGKKSRIDTTSTSLKKFAHEFVPINSINKSNEDYLFLFRAKLHEKGFSCDPNEDKDIIAYLKKIYNKNYVSDCEKNFELKEKENAAQLIDSLKKEVEELNKFKKKALKLTNEAPTWMIYSNVDALFGSDTQNSSFFKENVAFVSSGTSSSTGFIHHLNNAYEKGVFITSGLSFSSSTHSTDSDLDFQFEASEIDYVKRVKLFDYKELFKSTSFIIPIGVGYQFKDQGWPVYFQMSTGINFGVCSITTLGVTGNVSYSRYYENPGIEVVDQPSLGLVSGMELQNIPVYDSKTRMMFGAFANLKVLYNFSDSPFSGYINLTYGKNSSKLISNGSSFISEEVNNYNSILNSMQKFKSPDFQVGLGIVYEIRNKINLK